MNGLRRALERERESMSHITAPARRKMQEGTVMQIGISEVSAYV